MRISDWSSDVCSSDLKARILPDRPWATSIHRRADAAREGRETGEAGVGLDVLGRVERLDVDPLGGVPGEVLALHFLVGGSGPLVQRWLVGHMQSLFPCPLPFRGEDAQACQLAD